MLHIAAVSVPANYRWGGPIYFPPKTRGDVVKEIIADVARAHDVSAVDITGPTRVRKVCAARFEVAWRLHRLPWRPSSVRIGQLLGGRDHATILAAIKRHEQNMAKALDVANLQVLCEDCNLGKGNSDTVDWRGPQCQ